MVLRLEPSMIAFSLICLTITCSGNTSNQYMIWAPKDDIRDIAWVSSCPLHTGPSCVIVLFSVVSDTSALVYYPDCSSFIVISPPVVWFGALVGWDLGPILAGA